MKLFKAIICTCLLFAVIACDIREPDFEYLVSNMCNDTICYYISRDDEYQPSKQRLCPLDTLPPLTSQKHSFWWYWDWSQHSMAVVFYKAEALRGFSWTELQESDYIDSVKVYSLEDLVKHNYSIVYR